MDVQHQFHRITIGPLDILHVLLLGITTRLPIPLEEKIKITYKYYFSLHSQPGYLHVVGVISI